MRKRWRVLAFDILAPVAVVAALVFHRHRAGVALWWVSVCQLLCC